MAAAAAKTVWYKDASVAAQKRLLRNAFGVLRQPLRLSAAAAAIENAAIEKSLLLRPFSIAAAAVDEQSCVLFYLHLHSCIVNFCRFLINMLRRSNGEAAIEGLLYGPSQNL